MRFSCTKAPLVSGGGRVPWCGARRGVVGVDEYRHHVWSFATLILHYFIACYREHGGAYYDARTVDCEHILLCYSRVHH